MRRRNKKKFQSKKNLIKLKGFWNMVFRTKTPSCGPKLKSYYKAHCDCSYVCPLWVKNLFIQGPTSKPTWRCCWGWNSISVEAYFLLSQSIFEQQLRKQPTFRFLENWLWRQKEHRTLQIHADLEFQVGNLLCLQRASKLAMCPFLQLWLLKLQTSLPFSPFFKKLSKNFQNFQNFLNFLKVFLTKL